MAQTQFMAGSGTPGLVSVIIPSYNRQEYVGASIESALAQTYPRYELIVVDDGSTDDTEREVRRFQDPRVQYFRKPNGGLSSARNFGLERASGEFIAFLDSDDLWLSWKLSVQIGLLARHPDVGLIWTDTSTFRRQGEILEERYLRTGYGAYGDVEIERICTRMGTLADLDAAAPSRYAQSPYYVGDICDEMFYGNLVHPPSAIMRRSRLQQSGPYEPDVTGDGGDDYHFYYRVCEKGRVALIDAPTMLYRLHESQIVSSRSLQEARSDLRIVKHWLKRRPPALPASRIRARVAASHRWVGMEELRWGDSRQAKRHLWQSVLLNPTRLDAISLLLLSLLPLSLLRAARATKRLTQHARTGLFLRLASLTGVLYILLRCFVFLEPEFAEV